mmetsp:Transcript_114804/g.199680  ORF Transcript_114804/g.199680 Transcript_114804/m.199680 type:complete len:103 (+) Transcript_114804:430-738(+)
MVWHGAAIAEQEHCWELGVAANPSQNGDEAELGAPDHGPRTQEANNQWLSLKQGTIPTGTYQKRIITTVESAADPCVRTPIETRRQRNTKCSLNQIPFVLCS